MVVGGKETLTPNGNNSIIFLDSSDDDDDAGNEDLTAEIIENARKKAEGKRKMEEKKKDEEDLVIIDPPLPVILNVSYSETSECVENTEESGMRSKRKRMLNSGSMEDVKTEDAKIKLKKKREKERKRKPKTEKEGKLLLLNVEASNNSFSCSEVDLNGLSQKLISEADTLDEVFGTPEDVKAENAENIDNTIMRKLLRGPRYFDPPEESWRTCFLCNLPGHPAASCPLKNKLKQERPCYVCGNFGHTAKSCPQALVCLFCKRTGHTKKDCTEKRKKVLDISKLCLRCGGYGHDMSSCRNNYEADDLKEIQCYICRKYGHLCCIEFVDSGPGTVSCYKCGLVGHTGLACAKSRQVNDVDASIFCYKCGEEGHIARGCNRLDKSTPRSNNVSTPQCSSIELKGAKLPIICNKCGEEGHNARRCRKFDRSIRVSDNLSTPQGSRTRASRVCYKCGEEGHIAYECNRLDKSSPFSGKQSTSQCSSVGVKSADASVMCYKCGQEGHIARECNRLDKPTRLAHNPSTSKCSPIGAKAAKMSTICYKCRESGHLAWECNRFDKSTQSPDNPSTPQGSFRGSNKFLGSHSVPATLIRQQEAEKLVHQSRYPVDPRKLSIDPSTPQASLKGVQEPLGFRSVPVDFSKPLKAENLVHQPPAHIDPRKLGQTSSWATHDRYAGQAGWVNNNGWSSPATPAMMNNRNLSFQPSGTGSYPQPQFQSNNFYSPGSSSWNPYQRDGYHGKHLHPNFSDPRPGFSRR